jgi:hypothetical protein
MKRNPWPYAIILYFIVFIIGIVAWVGFAMRNDQELVRADYYEHEIKYQSEIERLERASMSPAQINFQSDKRTLTIELPPMSTNAKIYFYRPATAKLDKRFDLRASTETMDVKNFERGLWRIRLAWNLNGAEYRHDQSLIL